jgi:simple sugar transport system ATP-binding protein
MAEDALESRAVPTLRLEKLKKRYGDVRAVDDVSVAFEPGRVHAVVGENGAGKSTLLKMGAGIVVPDAGAVLVDDAPLAPHTAATAIARGVGMVQQHFALVPVFTALENVMLGAEPTGALGRLDVARARAKIAKVAREIGAEIPLDEPVESLGVGDRQRLEIARALYRDARVLILDEPTAVLTPGEADALYATLRRLAEAGRTIVVVTHKLDEVRDHADVVSVMRRGELVTTRALAKDEDEVRALAAAIMGGEPPPEVTRRAPELGEMAIRVKGVRHGRALRGVGFDVRAGEIVGIAGVEGNGQRELVRVLAGLEVADAGAVEGGPFAVVHEDRHEDGLVLDASVSENLMLGDLGRYARMGVLDLRALDRDARARLDAAKVVPPDGSLAARALSGGNQQKVVVERAIARTRLGARALVVAHPTRGVDLGASRAIHDALRAAAARGVAVVVVSADLHELRALSDRILVMARGAIAAELPPTASDHELGAAMLSAPSGEARA